MKKLLSCLLVLLFSFSVVLAAYQASPQEELLVDTVSDKISDIIEKKMNWNYKPVLDLLKKFESKVTWNERNEWIIDRLSKSLMQASGMTDEAEMDMEDKEAIDMEDEPMSDTMNMVTLTTDYWTMEIKLYDSTPLHRDNFLELVEEWFYDDLLFHRVIEWFMIQWWDPDSRDAQPWVSLWRWWPWYLVDAEIWEPHYKWTLAAARTGWPSNPDKKSSWSQFYIVQWWSQTNETLDQMEARKWITYTTQQRARYVKDWWTPMLDNDYTVFGEVTSWLEVIDAIAAVQKDRGDRPLEDIKMTLSIKQ